MEKFIMAIDQGTTGSRVLIIDSAGRVRASEYAEFAQIYPEPGWVAHDAEVIWTSTLGVIRAVLASGGLAAEQIAAIGITNQRETTVLWDKVSLQPVHHAIVWQCRRSAGICDELKGRGAEALFRRKTGLLLDAYFSGTKIKWLLDEVRDLRARAEAGNIAFGTIDSWLVARLTGGKVHVTDHTNAARTLLYDIHRKLWDPELLQILQVPPSILPQVVPSAGVVGETDPAVFGAAVPIAGIAGDQQAALFGQGCVAPGQAKNTYGTGCFMLLNVGAAPVDPGSGLLLTLACGPKGQPCYALEGSVFIGGAVIQWLRDGLGLIETAAETQAVAASVDDAGGVYLVPAFAGLGAPYWDMYARGGLLGITRGTTRAHVIRAALEGIAFQVKDLMVAFEQAAGHGFGELRVDGGACRNDFLMQFQADILGCRINRSRHTESTGLGAAFLAGIAVGFWDSSEQIAALRSTDRIFEPNIDVARREKLYAGWRAAVDRVRSDATCG